MHSTVTGAESLVRRRAMREVIPRDPRYSVRWHRHDFPDPIARWNFHPEFEIHLITRGSGRFIVGDHVGNFNAGQLVLVGPEVPHHWISDIGPGEQVRGRDVVLQFQEQWLASSTKLMPELADLQAMLASANRGVQFLGETARRGAALLVSIGEEEGTKRLVSTLSLLDLLASAPRDERRYLANEWLPMQDDPESADVVNKTLNYIFEHLDEEVSLSVVARTVGMSESAFSRYFKRASGYNFSDIVRKLRVAHACKLLDTTTDSVASIAHAVGYSNLSNFNRQFRVETSSTPREWRKRSLPHPPLAS